MSRILYRKRPREYGKPQFKIGDRVCIRKYDWPFKKGYMPQFTQKGFEIVAFSCRKPPTDTKKDEQAENIRCKFYQKELNKVTKNETVYNRVSFPCICTTFSRQDIRLFDKHFTGPTESGKSEGGCNFGYVLPINVPKSHRWIAHVS